MCIFFIYQVIIAQSGDWCDPPKCNLGRDLGSGPLLEYDLEARVGEKPGDPRGAGRKSLGTGWRIKALQLARRVPPASKKSHDERTQFSKT